MVVAGNKDCQVNIMSYIGKVGRFVQILVFNPPKIVKNLNIKNCLYHIFYTPKFIIMTKFGTIGLVVFHIESILSKSRLLFQQSASSPTFYNIAEMEREIAHIKTKENDFWG